MKNTFIQKILFLLVLFFSSVVLSHGTVIIPNVEHDRGYIDVKIYDSKDSFLKEDEAVEAVRKKVNKGEVVVPLTKILRTAILTLRVERAVFLQSSSRAT